MTGDVRPPRQTGRHPLHAVGRRCGELQGDLVARKQAGGTELAYDVVRAGGPGASEQLGAQLDAAREVARCPRAAIASARRAISRSSPFLLVPAMVDADVSKFPALHHRPTSDRGHAPGGLLGGRAYWAG